ncbi:MAG: CocE/NonD family hydrolase [Armatimonadetes bacterium]|nr:CocE/NonD family hydrolase [Armatimonadota bacterium]
MARAQETEWFLRAGGGLSPGPPGEEPPDTYLYDPADPAPTHGGNHSIGPYNPGLYELAPPGPFDQREVEARPDVLTFTSEPLPADLEVTGPVSLLLYAASDGPDTDFVARLCDAFPDGRSINLTEGVLRCRFRHGVWAAPELMQPGEVYALEIDLDVTSNLFRAGHRVRLDITSSNFPLWDRNLNTGGDPATDTDMRVARQTIHHDQARPSHLRLPVVAR